MGESPWAWQRWLATAPPLVAASVVGLAFATGTAVALFVVLIRPPVVLAIGLLARAVGASGSGGG